MRVEGRSVTHEGYSQALAKDVIEGDVIRLSDQEASVIVRAVVKKREGEVHLLVEDRAAFVRSMAAQVFNPSGGGAGVDLMPAVRVLGSADPVWIRAVTVLPLYRGGQRAGTVFVPASVMRSLKDNELQQWIWDHPEFHNLEEDSMKTEESAIEAHAMGRHKSTHPADATFWAKTCEVCAISSRLLPWMVSMAEINARKLTDEQLHAVVSLPIDGMSPGDMLDRVVAERELARRRG